MGFRNSWFVQSPILLLTVAILALLFFITQIKLFFYPIPGCVGLCVYLLGMRGDTRLSLASFILVLLVSSIASLAAFEFTNTKLQNERLAYIASFIVGGWLGIQGNNLFGHFVKGKINLR